MRISERPPIAVVPYAPPRPTAAQSMERIERAYARYAGRRSVRHFSSDPVPREVVEGAIRVAGTAPSGAHRQPWHFVAISDADLKLRIREAAEEEERAFYEHRATTEWLEALAPLGTDFVKAHITDAPWLIVVFRRDADPQPDGRMLKNYYVTESVGIAVGFLIAALHEAGIATLTHTPAPMSFLRDICGRPKHEKPFVIMPIGYPAEGCEVPDIARKPLEAIAEIR